MNIEQKTIALVFLLFWVVGSWSVKAREVTLRGGDKWDLTQEDQQVQFREHYKNELRARACIARADYAVMLMHERNTGTTEEEHLEVVRQNYERTRTEPEGVVRYHIYVDFQRMVRDIHRRHGRRFSFTDANLLWEQEVWWCIFPIT